MKREKEGKKDHNCCVDVKYKNGKIRAVEIGGEEGMPLDGGFRVSRNVIFKRLKDLSF